VETIQPTCEVATGSFSVTGADGLEYSIDGQTFSASGSYESLAAGTYTVTARNAEGCVSLATSVTINAQPEDPAAPIVAETVQPTCDVATGSFTVTGADGLEYSIDGFNYIASGSFEGLAAGTYTVTAKNADGCVSEGTSITIDAQPETPTAPVVADTFQATCDVATGSFTVTVVEGLQY